MVFVVVVDAVVVDVVVAAHAAGEPCARVSCQARTAKTPKKPSRPPRNVWSMYSRFQEGNSSLRCCLTAHDFPGYESEGVGLQGRISGGCQQKLTKVPARPQRHLDVDVGQGHQPEAVLMP